MALKNLSSTLRVSLPLAHIHPNIALVLKAVKVAAAESGEVPRPLSPVKGHRVPSTRRSRRAFRGSVRQDSSRALFGVILVMRVRDAFLFRLCCYFK